MKEYFVCEWALSYGISLTRARRLKDDEKGQYAEWFKDYGFVGLGDRIELNELHPNDLKVVLARPLNKPDGAFNGCSNQAYIINQTIWSDLIRLNTEKMTQKEQIERDRKIIQYENIIIACRKTKRLFTEHGARQARIDYNKRINEDGEGFIPHFYTVEDYENAKRMIKHLKNQ